MEVSQSPLWVTMVSWVITGIGWVVMIVAAIIPGIISRNKQKAMELDIEELKREKAATIDRARFYDERSNLVENLEKYERAFKFGNAGFSTLSGFEQLLTRINSYAIRLNFPDSDRKTISESLNRVEEAIDSQTILELHLRPADVEKIKNIIEKGENLL